jgi:cell division protein FtsW (lipid II flippase)
MKRHLWKIFEFSGWFITLVGIIFALLYASISVGAELYGAVVLIAVGAVLILVGEYQISEETGDKSKFFMIWQALSIGGAFSLTVGIIWLAIQFLASYESWFSIVILLALGVGLIIVGESIKLEKE